jgi:hypothetical protein
VGLAGGRSEWWNAPDAHANLSALWDWLDKRAETPGGPGDGVSYFLEKPWKWTHEYTQMRREEARSHGTN